MRIAQLPKIKKSAGVKNLIFALVGSGVNLLMKFISQRIFIETLNVEYLGLNGVLTNVIAVLSIVELGINSAIIYNLYEPIKKKRWDTVKSLLSFYRRAYRIIAGATVLIGLIIMPFLHLIVQQEVGDVNIYIAYILVLASSVVSYFLSYRQSIIYATENGRITTLVQMIGNVVLGLAQILILIATENYYAYLTVKIVVQLAENILLHGIAAEKFPIVKEKPARELEKSIRSDIYKKMRALFTHKIAGFIINGTDNIIISIFLGLTTVGYYANYQVIFGAIESIFTHGLTALTPTVGNILVDKDQKKNYETFRKVQRVNFIIAITTSLGALLLVDTVIKIWVGDNYTLPSSVLVVLVVVHFQKMMRNSYLVFKEAAGIFHEDRWVPVAESLINIVASVVLVQVMGLAGVFVGTFLSSLALWCYSYPKYVYKRLFHRSYRQYAVETGMQFLIFAAAVAMVLIIKNMVGA